jgi:hypothetical protein
MKTTLLLFATILCTQINAMDKSFRPDIALFVAPDSKEVRNSKLIFGDHVPLFVNPPWNPSVHVWHTDYKALLAHATEAIRSRKLTLEDAYPKYIAHAPEAAEDVAKAITELTTLEQRLDSNYFSALAKELPLTEIFVDPLVKIRLSIPTADIRDCAQWTDGGKQPALVLTFATGKILMVDNVGLANILLNLPRL